MKARLAIIAMLALGSVLASSAVALGASSLSDTTNASAAQYGAPRADDPEGGNLGEDSGGGGILAEDGGGGGGVSPAREQSSLPFTGSGSLPWLLMIGGVLIVAGIVLRNVRSTSEA